MVTPLVLVYKLFRLRVRIWRGTWCDTIENIGYIFLKKGFRFLESDDNATFIHRTDTMGNITGEEERVEVVGEVGEDWGGQDTTETTDTELERMATSEDQNTGTQQHAELSASKLL